MSFNKQIRKKITIQMKLLMKLFILNYGSKLKAINKVKPNSDKEDNIITILMYLNAYSQGFTIAERMIWT